MWITAAQWGQPRGKPSFFRGSVIPSPAIQKRCAWIVTALVRQASVLFGEMWTSYPHAVQGENGVIARLCGNIPIVPTTTMRTDSSLSLLLKPCGRSLSLGSGEVYTSSGAEGIPRGGIGTEGHRGQRHPPYPQLSQWEKGAYLEARLHSRAQRSTMFQESACPY